MQIDVMQIEFIDRASGKKVTESVMGDKALRFAYETLLGRTLWPVLFGSKAVSAVIVVIALSGPYLREQGKLLLRRRRGGREAGAC